MPTETLVATLRAEFSILQDLKEHVPQKVPYKKIKTLASDLGLGACNNILLLLFFGSALLSSRPVWLSLWSLIPDNADILQGDENGEREETQEQEQAEEDEDGYENEQQAGQGQEEEEHNIDQGQGQQELTPREVREARLKAWRDQDEWLQDHWSFVMETYPAMLNAYRRRDATNMSPRQYVVLATSKAEKLHRIDIPRPPEQRALSSSSNNAAIGGPSAAACSPEAGRADSESVQRGSKQGDSLCLEPNLVLSGSSPPATPDNSALNSHGQVNEAGDDIEDDAALATFDDEEHLEIK